MQPITRSGNESLSPGRRTRFGALGLAALALCLTGTPSSARASLMVSNINQTTAGQVDITAATTLLATGFVNNGSTNIMTTVILPLVTSATSVNARVDLYSNDTGTTEPDTLIASSNIVAVNSTTETNYTFTFAPTYLAPSQTFWLVLTRTSGTSDLGWFYTTSTSTDPDSLPGTSIVPKRLTSLTNGVAWDISVANQAFRFTAQAPEPSSFALVGLCAGGLGLAAYRRRRRQVPTVV